MAKSTNNKVCREYADNGCKMNYRQKTNSTGLVCFDKQRMFEKMCRVLVKQAGIHNGIETLSEEHLKLIKRDGRALKSQCLAKIAEGEPVFECAKQFYAMHHLTLIQKTEEWGYKDYNLYLEGKWIQHRFLDLGKYEGARRIIQLIKNPNRGFSPLELFHASNETVVVYESAAPESSTEPSIDYSDWQIAMLWELYNTVDTNELVTAISDELSINDGKLNYEIADERYIMELIKERTKLLRMKKEGVLTPAQENVLDSVTEVINEIFGYSKSKRMKYARCKSRLFKDTMHNRTYSCMKMSITRLKATFLEGSIERAILEKNIRFEGGKFYWGSPNASIEKGGC